MNEEAPGTKAGADGPEPGGADAAGTNKVLGRAALAAVILLAPGGFVLGTTLAVRHWRKKRAKAAEAAADDA